MNHPKIFFRVHAVQRMFERKISVRNVFQVLQSGEVIEDYSSEMSEQSQLILGFQGKRPFHTVISGDPKTSETTVITVYVPDLERWNKNFRRRRS